MFDKYDISGREKKLVEVRKLNRNLTMLIPKVTELDSIINII